MAFFPAAPRRILRPLLVAVVLMLVIFITYSRKSANEQPKLPSIYTYTDGKTSRPWSELTSKVGPSNEGLWIRQLADKYDLAKDLKYYSQRIKPTETDVRQSMVDMRNVDFRPGNPKSIKIRGDTLLRIEAERELSLPVVRSLRPGQVNASSILFGVATTYSRVASRDWSMINDWKFWLTNGRGQSNGGTLYVSLYKSDNYDVEKVREKLKEAGIDAHVETTDEGVDSAMRYLDMIRALAIRSSALFIGGAKKNWLGVVDDDTFFPNMGQLIERLGKYDVKAEMYVGVPSERADWVADSDMSVTYGGGAIFLTPSTASRVSTLPCQGQAEGDEVPRYRGQWDALLYECMSNYTNLSMHVLPSYYAPTDEIYGTNNLNYELGIAPLALHHPANRHGMRSPGKSALSAVVAGEGSFFQRYRFPDNWILINGLACFQFPNGQDVKQLGAELPDGEWEKAVNEYHAATTMPLEYNIAVDDDWRKSREWKVITWAESRRAWNFLDSVISEDGREVWQAYLRKKGETGLYTDRARKGDYAPDDSVIVLRWDVSGQK